MNERIKELIAEANMTLKPRRPYDEEAFGDVYLESDLDYFNYNLESVREFFEGGLEKFAELIVRECVIISMEQKKWVEDMTVFNPMDESWNEARIQQSQRIIDKIKEHFGVEE